MVSSAASIFGRPITEFWSLYTWLMAFVGSIIVLAIWGAIKGRSGSRAA